ncbi:MAG: alpha-glucosidase C-terminal domain-containing protein [Chloroflexi bacterium]|uniref:glycoside hydrolase family 13 protein n=1 Tax=Candidatus Flexifilum breve TaxID=3140694 RepID=UPI0031372366|nr:alpha-glucosidase C-terminal domain-containing protein [Chloroflexota bacterium]
MNPSYQAARKLRPEGAFHLPPTAQPLGAIVDLILEDSEYQPEVYLTDTRRELSWHLLLDATETPGTWRAQIKLPSEPTIVTYMFQFHAPQPTPPLLEIRQIEGRNTAIYGEWTQLPFKIAVYDPLAMPADWTQGMVIYQIFPDRFANGDPSTDHLMKGVYGHEPHFHQWGDRPEHPPLGRDFYGGDLRGVIQKLDYIAELGIDTIYFTPIFDAPTNHRYDAIDYFKIDPMLGTLDDFRELLSEAHGRDLKIVLDAVFNHCSSDSLYFDITDKFGGGAYASKQSPYYRWFDFEEHPTKYRGWIGLGFMPEFVECPEVEEFFCGPEGVTAYWLRAGIDGWRCDVAFDNSDEFWRRFRKRVEQTRPGAYTVSELWLDSTHYLLGDTFNATMNYRFTWAARGFLAEDMLTPSEVDDRLAVLRRDTPPPALKAQMNQVDSHDSNRILTVAGGDVRRVKQVLAFQLSYPGAPMIYYGGETGLEGDYAEDGRRCMPWDNLNHELIGDFKHAIHTRRDLAPLRYGDFEALVIDDAQRVYAFARTYQGETVYCAFNASDAAATVALTVGGGAWTDVLNGTPATVSGDQLTAQIAPRSCAWFVKA